MNQALCVRRCQALSGLHSDPHDLAQRQRLFSRQPLFERFARDELHYQ